jgi:hypothetical protein
MGFKEVTMVIMRRKPHNLDKKIVLKKKPRPSAS